MKLTKGGSIHMIHFECELSPGKTAGHRKSRCRLLALFCLLAILVAAPVSGQKSSGKGTFEYASSKGWFAGLTMKYEAATARAESLLIKAQASVSNTRKIHAMVLSSDSNAQIKARANKALLNAEALEKRARADLVAARAALAVLRGGSPDITSGMPLAFVTMDQDAYYVPGNKGEPESKAFFGIAPGDRLETGPAGRIRLHLLDDGLESEIQLGSDSRLVAQEGDGKDAAMQLFLRQGRMRITDISKTSEAKAAAEQRKNVLDLIFSCIEKGGGYYDCAYGHIRAKFQKRFEIRTPSVALAARATEYVLAHDEAKEVTILKVLEGEVAMFSDRHGQALLVGAGQEAKIDAAGLSLLEAGVDVTAERGRWEE